MSGRHDVRRRTSGGMTTIEDAQVGRLELPAWPPLRLATGKAGRLVPELLDVQGTAFRDLC
jgi:hypothetical protein